MAKSKARIEMNGKGIRALLQSAGIRADLERRAARIAAAAGEGFTSNGYTGRNRARAGVVTATSAARRAQAEDKALTRAIDAGR